MASNTWTKDPDAVLDWEMDWHGASPGPWLADTETITTSTWVIPDGLTKQSDTHTTTTATVWLSGGVAGTTYKVTNRVTTSAGRTDDRSITIKVADR